MYLHSWEMLRMQLFNQKTYFFLCQGACPKFEPILQIAIFFQKLIMYKFLCQVACLEFEPLLQITVFHKTLIWKGPKSENIGNQQV